MTNSAGTPLDQARYVNLETFRRNGTGVKTPVWAAALDGCLVIFTDGTSYKVKRLRRNTKVRIAACDARGNVRGPWYDAECAILNDPDQIRRSHAALRAKYGWQVVVLDFFSRLFRRIQRRAYLAVTIDSPVSPS